MSIQTQSMRENSDRNVNAFKGEDGLWHGDETVNHPTPSGCERWLLTYSDKRGWSDADTAVTELNKLLASVRQQPIMGV